MATIAQWQLQVRRALVDAGVPEDEAGVESELILREKLKLDRAKLHLRAHEEIPDQLSDSLKVITSRRLKREPLAYIFGHWSFYGLDLIVTPDVLIPRHETEGLVDLTLMVCQRFHRLKPSLKLVDVGTGSGAVAVVLAKEGKVQEVLATESSEEALKVARRNVRKHRLGGKVKLLEGDLLEPVERPLDVIVGNLPYIPTSRLSHLQPEVQWEPRQALDGGPDGLDVIRKLLVQAKDKLVKGGVILLEIDQGEAEPLREFSKGLFPNASVLVEKDLAGLDRYFLLEMPQAK